MSNRAEGCGQWLSARDQRTTKSKRSKKAQKPQHKALVKYGQRRPCGLNIQVSSSPLSPRTRRKLKTAKQSKINSYFTTQPRAVVSKRDQLQNEGLVSEISNLETRFEEKQTKIPVKRHRDNDDRLLKDTEVAHQPNCRQEKEGTDQSDCNISGISLLNDSSEESDVLTDGNMQNEFEDGYSELQDSHTFYPPRKRIRISEQGEKRTENNQSLSMESELSESFHFTQWRKYQIAKCREIQRKSTFGENPGTDQSCQNSYEGNSCKVNCKGEETQFSETPPFQFTQWAKQQVEICHKIQNSKHLCDIPVVELHDSYKLNSLSEGSLGEKNLIGDSSDFPGLFSNWNKICLRTSPSPYMKFNEENESSDSDSDQSAQSKKVRISK